MALSQLIIKNCTGPAEEQLLVQRTIHLTFIYRLSPLREPSEIFNHLEALPDIAGRVTQHYHTNLLTATMASTFSNVRPVKASAYSQLPSIVRMTSNSVDYASILSFDQKCWPLSPRSPNIRLCSRMCSSRLNPLSRFLVRKWSAASNGVRRNIRLRALPGYTASIRYFEELRRGVLLIPLSGSP
jgi:hypothetical protein